jgi:ABC-2 type transport system permease protein
MNATTTPVLVELGVGALMPIGRVLRAYANEAKYELLRMLRTPAFALPFLVLPVPIYLFFGVVVPAAIIAKNPGVANYLFSGFSVFTVMGPALFGIGCGLAVERDAGLLTLKRALPVPSGGYLIAKILIGMAFAALAMILMLACAVLAGKITLSAPQLVIMFVVMVIGSVPFAAIGLFIGAFASGSAAPAYANIIFLPMLWLSGLFIPLPKFLEPWAVIWPAFHLNQVALGAAGVSEYSFVAPQISGAVLVGFTVLFGGVAIRRLARRG